MAIFLSQPDLQVDFAAALVKLRETYLQDALFATVKTLAVADLNRELERLAPAADLTLLASKGLRGEIAFATPILFQANPYLIAYYRLLLGYSRKEFYQADVGLARFKSMEEKGTIARLCQGLLDELCRSLNSAASYLIREISAVTIAKPFFDDLTLLTLGPQLRGNANVMRGQRGILKVFDVVKAIVDEHVESISTLSMTVVNASKRKVLIEFAADPDIVIREELASSANYRNILAIEVKGGSDYSNIHNRLGEAEKSHQKAKAQGYTECWTVVNVDKLDRTKAARESPSTNRFYLLSKLISGQGKEYEDFAGRIRGLTGIPSR